MFKNKKPAIAAGIIAVIAIYLIFAILFAKSGIKNNPLFYPGLFLYQYYFDSAFYIPIYLLICSFFLLKKKFNRNNIILLILTILPFMTISLALRLMYIKTNLGPFEKGLLKSFGMFAPFVVFLIAIAELLVIVRFGFYLLAQKKNDNDEKDVDGKNIEDNYPDSEADAGNPEENNYDDSDTSQDISAFQARPGFAELNFSYSPPSRTESGIPGKALESNKNSGKPIAITTDNIPDYVDDEIYNRPAYFRMGNKEEAGEEPYESDYNNANKPDGNIADSDIPQDEDIIEIEAINNITVNEEPYHDNPDEEDDENEDLLETESEDKEAVKVLTQSDDNPIVVREYFASQKKINLKKTSYKIPVDILDEYAESGFMAIDERTKEEAKILMKTLAEFKIEAEVTGIKRGPVITMFEILPAPGVKLSKITNLADNIALRLAASRVRIVAPIPGKHAVGIEVPNRNRAIVSFRELISVDYPQYSKYHLPIVLGKDITGEEQIIDLTQTPHLLIAGATGSGKSVCVNSIIVSLLYNKKPQEVRMILIDPKIVELKLYNDIPHLLTPVITDSKKAFQALQYCIYEMEKRYALLDALGVRDIHSFNKKIKSNKIATMPLPYIVVIVDEFADLMATTGKELESTLARLAAMSRAVGIHLVLATQRPSIDVITGLIKANIPSRIAFMVASKTDSRIIIDSVGAEMLLGKGDMLFTSSWNPYLTRIQGAYLSESEAERVVEKVREYGEPEYIDDEIFFDEEDDDSFAQYDDYGEDPLMDKALEIVAMAGKASASYLQRRLKIGYNRAARLVEEMERRGIVGPQNGSKPRDILNIPGHRKE